MPSAIRVLYGDASANDRDLVRHVLAREPGHFELTEADSRHTFEAYLADGEFDAVLTDFHLLGFDGLEVLDCVRRANPGLPVLVVTGSGNEEAAAEALKRGAADYVVKSHQQLHGLPQRIHHALQEQRLRVERDQALASLAESEARGRAILAAIPDALYRVGPSGLLAELYSRGEGQPFDPTILVGRHPADFLDPPAAAQAMQALEDALATGTHTTFEFTDEVNGLRRHLEIRLVPCAPDEALAIVRDLTAQRQLEEQLRQAGKMEAIGGLAGGIAHDFNNILTSILGYADLVLATLPESDARRPDVAEIARAAVHAGSLTRQLLTFSRRQAVAPALLDLNVVVAEAERLLRRTIGENVELATQLDPDLGLVFADHGQMAQVLLNLVINSRDAMPRGGRLAIETTRAHLGGQPDEPLGLTPGSYVRLSVSDTGQGMDAATRERVFEPFFTTKPAGIGTGLGLAIVYGVARQHHGAVRIDSEPGQGTTVSFFLPRAEAPTAAEPEAPRDSGAGHGEVILLVEDEEALRTLITRELTQHGFAVLPAANAAEGLAAARQPAARIDLLLTDVVLPDGNGRELANAVREGRPGLNVLFMTGYPAGVGDAPDPARGEALLRKPFSLKLLREHVRRQLDQRR